MVHLPVLIKVTAMEVFHYSLTMNCTLLSLQKELLKNIKAKKSAPNRASAVTGQLLQQFNVTIICMVLGTYLVFMLYEEQIKINFMNNNTLSNSSVLLQAIGTLLVVNNLGFFGWLHLIWWRTEWKAELRVKMNRGHSRWLPVISGIPQVSAARSLLSHIFINYIDKEIKCTLGSYTDNMNLGRALNLLEVRKLCSVTWSG